MPDIQTDRNDYRWLAVILGLALVLRVFGLNAPLWYDEILTVDTHLRLPWGEMMQDYSMNHHYLFDLQSKLFMDLFGDSAWAVRMPAVLFGIGAIAAMWFLARDVAGSRVAHLTALLLALSYHHIWFSQNARGYTELAFWSTLGTLLFLRGMAAPKLGIWVGYGLVLALAVFTHLTGAFIFAAHGIVWLGFLVAAAISGRLSRAQMTMPAMGYLLGGLVTLLFYAPLLPSLFQTVGMVSGTSAVDVMQEYQNPIWTIYEGVRTAIGDAGPLVAIVAIAVIFLSVLGGIVAHKTAPLFGTIVVVHIGLTLVLLSALGMRIWPRFFFVDIGFLMLLIVLGVRRVSEFLSARFWPALAKYELFIIAALAMVAVSLVLASRNYVSPKQNLVGAVDYVAENHQPGDRVLAVGQAGKVFTGHYKTDWQIIMNSAEYKTAMATPGPTLVVVAFPGRSFRAIPEMDADTETSLDLLHRFPGTLGDGAVLVFRRE